MSDNFILFPQDEAHFINFINENYGLIIQAHQLNNLRFTIQFICEKYKIYLPAVLLNKIKNDVQCAECIELIKKITVDESYFFRDEVQFDFLKNNYLPKLIEKKRQLGDKQLRIWSAGCSKGQEIYSIAILLHQLLPDYDDWNLHLLGTDVSYKVLNDAKIAHYNSWSIRIKSDSSYYKNYFNFITDESYALNKKIKDSVKFSYVNLSENTFPSIMNGICSLDLILCRNVFIYFDKKVIEKTLEKFSESLNEEGCLLLAASDPLHIKTQGLGLETEGDVFYFKKKLLTYQHNSVPSSQVEVVKRNALPIKLSDKKNSIKVTSKADNLKTIKSSIIRELSKADWVTALLIIEKTLVTYTNDSDLYQFQAKCLTNMGRMKAAKVACEKSIEYDMLEPHSYLLYGLILMQLGLFSKAEQAFRQTIFLNNSFMEAHYQLGQLLLRQGLKTEAVKFIQNAIDISNKEPADRPIHNVITLTYAGFSQAMKSELALIENKVEFYE